MTTSKASKKASHRRRRASFVVIASWWSERTYPGYYPLGFIPLDAYMDEHRLDAVLFPATTGAITAKAGYPSVQVPAGFVAGIRDKETPDYS